MYVCTFTSTERLLAELSAELLHTVGYMYGECVSYIEPLTATRDILWDKIEMINTSKKFQVGKIYPTLPQARQTVNSSKFTMTD